MPTLTNDEIIAQINDLMSRDKDPMCPTGYIGRKIFGYDYQSNSTQGQRLRKILNAMHKAKVVYKVGTSEECVWMLRQRDVRVCLPEHYNSIFLGEIPF